MKYTVCAHHVTAAQSLHTDLLLRTFAHDPFAVIAGGLRLNPNLWLQPELHPGGQPCRWGVLFPFVVNFHDNVVIRAKLVERRQEL